MWHRDDTRPTSYNSIRFRSALEAAVAEQLDKLGVTWQYEQPVEGINWYLPDFTILDAPEDLELPRWVEVKPAGLLYAVRDHLGLAERFEGTHKADIDAAQMNAAQLTEVWKPKRLAEVADQDVLVIYQVNATRSLSILMLPDRVELSRSHPAVNYRQVLKDRERERERARYEAEAERRRIERAEEERLRAEELREHHRHLITYARFNGLDARYPGWCAVCGEKQPAEAVLAFRYADDRWGVVCRAHTE